MLDSIAFELQNKFSFLEVNFFIFSLNEPILLLYTANIK